MADRRFICSCYSHAFIASATTRLASSSSPSGSPNSKRQIHFTPPPRREIQPIKVRHCTAQFSFSFFYQPKSLLHLFPGHYSLDHSNCECHQSQRTPVDLAKGNDSWKMGKVKWDRFSMIFNKRRWIRLQLCKDPLGAILNFSLIYVIPNCMACKQCVTPPQPRAYHLPIGRGWWRSFALGGAGDSVHNRHRTGRRNLWLETFLSWPSQPRNGGSDPNEGASRRGWHCKWRAPLHCHERNQKGKEEEADNLIGSIHAGRLSIGPPLCRSAQREKDGRWESAWFDTATRGVGGWKSSLKEPASVPI